MTDGRQPWPQHAALAADPRVVPFILNGTVLLGDSGLVWLNATGEWMTQEEFLQATDNLINALKDVGDN